MLNFTKELHPLYVSANMSKLFDCRIQFHRYLQFNKGFYVKQQKLLLYFTDAATNFSPISVILPKDEYERILIDFEKYNELELFINTLESRLISCRQEIIASISLKDLSDCICVINECLNLEQENCMTKNAISELEFYIINEDQKKTEEYVMKLIGLGEGLTPAFDDLLIGLLWVFDAFHSEFNMVKKAVEKNLMKKNTTLVSNAFYSCAFESYYSCNLIRLGIAIKNRQFSRVKDIIYEIQCYGCTSGKYLLYGIFVGLSALKNGNIL